MFFGECCFDLILKNSLSFRGSVYSSNHPIDTSYIPCGRPCIKVCCDVSIQWGLLECCRHRSAGHDRFTVWWHTRELSFELIASTTNSKELLVFGLIVWWKAWMFGCWRQSCDRKCWLSGCADTVGSHGQSSSMLITSTWWFLRFVCWTFCIIEGLSVLSLSL
jgi:hypothetical protein